MWRELYHNGKGLCGLCITRGAMVAVPEVKLDFRISRLQARRFLILGKGLGMVSEFVEFDSQVIVRVRIRRHQLNRIHKGSACLFVLLKIAVGIAEVVVRLAIIRFQSNNRAVGSDCIFVSV